MLSFTQHPGRLQVRALLSEQGMTAEHSKDGRSFADMEAQDALHLSPEQASASVVPSAGESAR